MIKSKFNLEKNKAYYLTSQNLCFILSTLSPYMFGFEFISIFAH